MQTHNIGGVDAQRAVDKHIDVGQQTFAAQTVEGVDDFLRTTDGERRNDELAFLLGAGVERSHQQVLLGGIERGVQTVAVGRLHQQVVNLRKRLGIFEYMLVVAPHIARKAKLDKAAALLDFQIHAGAAENMASIEELYRHLTLDVELLVVRHADETAHTGLCIGLGIDRLNRRQPLGGTLLVEGVRIRLLNAAGVGQHNGTQVACGGRADDDAVKAQLVDIRNQSRMVDMGVREDEVVDLLWVETQIAVHSVGLEALALIHTAVEQYLQTSLRCDEVLASRHLACSS